MKQLYRHLVTEEVLVSKELGRYMSFGIRCADASGQTILQISDVCCDRAWIDAFAKDCTQQQIQPIHLLDVILDSIP